MQKISQLLKHKALALALCTGLATSCASSDVSDSPPEFPTSEAAFLDDSEQSTPVMDDSAVFADLNAAPADDDALMATTEVPASGEADSPFYNPIGGESLGRVAYTLYGSRSMRSALLEQNPELRGVQTLGSGQRVYFNFDQLKPQPTYLTKDLLDRYASQLASKIESIDLPRETVTLAPGETLQALSQRLYGTTRYWTEIFLLNHGSIINYDQVRAGTNLTVYQRTALASPAPIPAPESAPALEPVPVEEAPFQPVAQPVIPESQMDTLTAQPDSQPAPVQAVEPEPVPVDPIPETPSFQEQTAQPAAAPVAEIADTAEGEGFLANSANVRRIVYVALIVLIGGLAFFLTRSSKKKSFDMLDVTAADTAGSRPKLADKDSQKKGIG